MIPIVMRTLGTDTKGLVQGPGALEIESLVETIQTTALLKSVAHWDEFWRLGESYYHSDSNGKLSKE